MTGSAMAGTARSVLVYRQHLFVKSEVFILQQALSLRRHRPLFAGLTLAGPRPPEVEAVTLADAGPWTRAGYVARRNPSVWDKRLAGRAPALVHAHFGVDGVYALPLAKRLGKPLVVTLHGFDVTTSDYGLAVRGSPHLLNYLAFRRTLMREASLFLCVSDFIRRKAIERGFPEQRTIRHYIGIDADAAPERSASDRMPVVLHVARLVEKKGTEILIDAFAAICKTREAAMLWIVGDGPRRGFLTQQVERLGIADRVRFFGALPNEKVLDLLQKAAMLSLPSITGRYGDAEGLGMVLLEAGAAGIPVVGTLHGGIPEVIKDGENGLLVPERDAHALGAALARILDDSGMASRMGAAGRERAKKAFDLARQTATLETIYERWT